MSRTHVTPATIKSWYTVRSTETGIANCHTLVMSYYVQYCYLHCPPRTGGEAEGNGRERCSQFRQFPTLPHIQPVCPKNHSSPPQKQTRNDVFYVPTNVRYVSLLAYVLVMRTALLRHAHCTRKRKKMVGGNNGPLCYFEGTQPVGFLFCLTRKISWKMTNS